MGIPAYFSFIVKNHASVIRRFTKDGTLNIDNLYLDANSIIYDAIRNIDFTNLETSQVQHIIRCVISKIALYVENIQPSKTLMIAFDGVAPVAKLEQQRQRRFKSQYQLQIHRTIRKNPKLDPFNTTAITPGTKFMKELNDGIRNHFTNPSHYNLRTILLSLSNVPGEGEHKIFEYIRENAEEHKKDHTVIYGLDADLIMLCLNHLHLSDQIYLFRETPEFIKSISVELEPNELYYLDIKELAVALTKELTGETDTIRISKIADYILICFFLGNDFMPHFPALNIRNGGIHSILQAYKATIDLDKRIVLDDYNIDWPNLHKFVSFLAVLEENLFITETQKREKMSKRFYPTTTPEETIAKFESLPCIQRDLENKINPVSRGWQDRYYLNLFHNPVDRQAVCFNFLQMLEWNLKYYSMGCVDWRFKYNYHYPPLLQDLVYEIPRCLTTMVNPVAKNPVSELVQLCYVLPRNCLYLLPNKLDFALIENKDHWYVNKCFFIWAYCRYFWECHADLPEININELETFIEGNVMKK